MRSATTVGVTVGTVLLLTMLFWWARVFDRSPPEFPPIPTIIQLVASSDIKRGEDVMMRRCGCHDGSSPSSPFAVLPRLHDRVRDLLADRTPTEVKHYLIESIIYPERRRSQLAIDHGLSMYDSHLAAENLSVEDVASVVALLLHQAETR